MNTPTPEQLAKLPKWAQEYIAACHRERDDAVMDLQDYRDTQSPSSIFTRSYSINSNGKNYIQNDRVTFCLPNGEVDVTLKDDGIRISASGNCYQISVLPHVTNVVTIKLV